MSTVVGVMPASSAANRWPVRAMISRGIGLTMASCSAIEPAGVLWFTGQNWAGLPKRGSARRLLQGLSVTSFAP
jgi:hypothetical protein